MIQRTVARLAFLKRSLRPLAFRDINVDANYTCWTAVAVVRNEASRLDPPRLTVWANNAIFRVVLVTLLSKSLAAEGIDPSEVIRMHAASPFLARELLGSLGQAVDGRIARLVLDPSRADIDRETPNPGCFPCEPELRVAFDQRQLRPLALGNIVGNASHPHWSTLGIALNRAFCRNPPHLAGRIQTELHSVRCSCTEGFIEVCHHAVAVVWMDCLDHGGKVVWQRALRTM